MEKHVLEKFEASRIKFITVRNPVEKLCSDVVQDLLAEASFVYGKPLPPLLIIT
ncbi:hypothetical protein AXX17_AT1G05840 [Arabidopsis thaliana]|jgi:hypothetical protein|uniref:Uncharacterized protein n=1 Tax=Arabidopsis thaliana TaxID=3702 RepID=A0A178WDQ1_ARATH|nr:hypothetical protein AXX17_AT1G05840 [Arabidopsis thaliana]